MIALSHTAHSLLERDGEVSETVMTGTTLDISAICGPYISTHCVAPGGRNVESLPTYISAHVTRRPDLSVSVSDSDPNGWVTRLKYPQIDIHNIRTDGQNTVIIDAANNSKRPLWCLPHEPPSRHETAHPSLIF